MINDINNLGAEPSAPNLRSCAAQTTRKLVRLARFSVCSSQTKSAAHGKTDDILSPVI